MIISFNSNSLVRAATKKWSVPVSSSEALRVHSRACPASEPRARRACHRFVTALFWAEKCAKGLEKRNQLRGFGPASLWCGPGAGLPSILSWAQDCHTQSWRGHRIAPLNPGVGAGFPCQSCCGNRIALLPGIGARPRLPGIEASCRAHAKVEILPSKKNVEVVGLDNREKIFPVATA